MLNITLSADETLIERAQEKARQKRTTLNAEFRKWLQHYTQTHHDTDRRIQAYRQLMNEMSGISSAGRRFTRDEMNERGRVQYFVQRRFTASTAD